MVIITTIHQYIARLGSVSAHGVNYAEAQRKRKVSLVRYQRRSADYQQLRSLYSHEFDFSLTS